MVQAQLFSTSPFGVVKLETAASNKTLVARKKKHCHTHSGTLCVVSCDRTEIINMAAKLRQLYLIHDTHQLCTHLRIDGIKAVSLGFSGGNT